MRKRLILAFSLLAVVCLILISFEPSPVSSQSAKEKFNQGLTETAQGTGHTDLPLTSDNLPHTVGRIINVVLSFLGVIFLILMIYAGYTWMLARGNEEQVNKSKNIMISAITGLVIVLAAYAITAYFGSEIASVLTN